MSAEASVRSDGAARVVRLRDGARFALVVFVCARLALSLISVAAAGHLDLPADAISPGATVSPGWHNALDGTDRWDARWFQHIAVHGYEQNEGAAFFPGYPLAIRVLLRISPLGPLGAALLVSNISFLAALIVLYALTAREFDRETARRTVVLIAVFPTSFFFMAPYSESMFILAVLLAFWWIREDRWVAGGASGLVASLTRSFGVLLTPALLVEAWSHGRQGRSRRLALACTPLLGAIAYSGYWLVRAGDPLRALHAQGEWHRSFGLFVVNLGWALTLAIRGIGHVPEIYWTVDFVLTLLLLIPPILRWRSTPATYLVYVATVALVALSFTPTNKPLLSDPRLFLILFPSFWAMTSIVGRRGFVSTVIVLSVGYVAAASVYMNWGWVV
jgi:hypothetical protein